MNILGFNCCAHNAAACVLRDGELVAAAQQERFTRVKIYGDFPLQAIRYCLQAAGLRYDDLDHVTFHWKPWHRFHRRVAMTLRHLHHFHHIVHAHSDKWLDILLAQRALHRHFPSSRHPAFHRVEHHLSRAASAFLRSPFDTSAIMVLDGTGEMAATSTGAGTGTSIRIIDPIDYPHSLGYLFVAR